MEIQAIDHNTILTIFQALGLVFGAGAAFIGSFLIFRLLEYEKLDDKDVLLINFVGKMVWGGLFVLILSTLILFLQNIEEYTDSSLFWVQLSVLFVVFLNSWFFHQWTISKLKVLTGSNLKKSMKFDKLSSYLFSGMGVSVISWVWLIVLEGLSFLPFSYWVLISVYLLTLIVSVLTAFVFRQRFFNE